MPLPWTLFRSFAVLGTTFTMLFGPGLLGVPLALGLRRSRLSFPFLWLPLILGKGLAELFPFFWPMGAYPISRLSCFGFGFLFWLSPWLGYLFSIVPVGVLFLFCLFAFTWFSRFSGAGL